MTAAKAGKARLSTAGRGGVAPTLPLYTADRYTPTGGTDADQGAVAMDIVDLERVALGQLHLTQRNLQHSQW
ncbi:MAG: hypothetical protein WCS20_17700, partial [Alphaproteobacteria bacterium]